MDLYPVIEGISKHSRERPLFLVVDENDSVRSRIRQFLAINGYVAVEEAENGKQAVSKFRKHHPEIILMATDLPLMDGFSACAEIVKQAGETEIQTSVILITPLDDEDAVDRAFKAGASECISKPIRWSTLTNRLQLHGISVAEYDLADLTRSRAKAEWEQVFNVIQDPVMIVTPDSTIMEANRATMLAARKSRKEIIGQGACEIVHGGKLPHYPCPLEELLSSRTGKIMKTKLPGLHGEYLLTVSPIPNLEGEVERIILVARGLSEEEIRKAEAWRTAQLAAIGELAAGVAHEINNPINGIINYAQVLLDEAENNPSQEKILRKIIKEGERISVIVRNLLSFSRDHEEDKEQANILQVIEDSLSLIKHQLQKDGITLEFEVPPDLPAVYVNAQQIQQVLLNLLSNSRYALNQRYPSMQPGKKLRITGGTTEIDNHGYVRITMTDWGTGIPQGVMDRLFDPFFSTKPAGDGTGLGLSISHSLIRDNNGFIHIDSRLNDYTTVILDLPTEPSQGKQGMPGETGAHEPEPDAAG